MDDTYDQTVANMQTRFIVIDCDHKGVEVGIRKKDIETGVATDKVANCRKEYLPAWFDGYTYGSGGVMGQLSDDEDPINRLRSIELNLVNDGSNLTIIQGNPFAAHGQRLHIDRIYKIRSTEELEVWLNGCEYARHTHQR